MASTSISLTYGALLLGGLYASILSGLVLLQVVIYFKLYPRDPVHTKGLVLGIWTLDALHTALIWAGLWIYLIENFGRLERIDSIPWAISATVAVTGILTFVVHCFFCFRIYRLSHKNLFLTIPIGLIALCRLVSASGTTAAMVVNDHFTLFRSKFYWLFTLGLALSTVADILIAGFLFFLLKTVRTNDFNLNAIIDALILYAFETGFLTAAGTVVAMLCWLTMSQNLIFMALHFVIGKLYANSILVTLNTRRNLRRGQSTSRRSRSGDLPTRLSLQDSRRKSRITLQSNDSSGNIFPPIRSPKVTINIEHCVEVDTPENMETTVRASEI
ncbi:hypothetical protein AGABI1DRAFT_67820 [Agaricus bisporus var. burnettii JB137-S8]|uniref:DUF6534 domain-containing protein n=1 Tax=Agaricus bisporus var. burnettii (strain JB137-S8 / ATCC MYA-4627 / FGSC 10392) TaxID=597362 RepID=K5WBZ6_AGABU|nr:uncharacterized protein AGABI1DRAFT_67820 [Agaricus bisporus var. burnettii JB137-S8]EKM84424.1 hypothetical protein AGABI1DRAFT_67820 [Agaricus bisporus var. burnettii JB137-S8]